MHCPRCAGTIPEGQDHCQVCGTALGPGSTDEILVRLTARLRTIAEAHERQGTLLTEIAADLRTLRAARTATEAPLPAPAPGKHADEVQDFRFDTPTSPGIAPSPHRALQGPEKIAAPLRVDTSPSLAPSPAPRKTENQQSRFELRLGQRWLLVAGIVIMVFGVGYFLKYSFDRGWIAPTARVALTYGWALAFLVGGELFRRRGYEAYGLAVMGGGMAVLYFASFSANALYHLIGPETAFALMILTTALGMWLAVLRNAMLLALLGLLGGFLTPIVLDTGPDQSVAFLSYVTILNLGILATTLFKRWHALARLGCLGAWSLFSFWYFGRYTPDEFWTGLLFCNLFWLIFTLVPFFYDLRTRADEVEPKASLLSLPSGLLAFGFSLAMIADLYDQRWAGSISAVYALVSAGLCRILAVRKRRETTAYALLAGNALFYAVLTVPVLLQGIWITLFWALQAAALFWSAQRLQRPRLAFCALALIGLTTLKLLLYDYDDVFQVINSGAGVHFQLGYGHLLTERYATTLAVLGALFFMTWQARQKGTGGNATPALAAMFIGTLFLILNIECLGLFHAVKPGAADAAQSVLWTVFAISLTLAGFRLNASPLRITALILFGLTMAKVFLLDMAELSTPYRIVSFLVLGLVLVATSFLYHRLRRPTVSPSETPGQEP